MWSRLGFSPTGVVSFAIFPNGPHHIYDFLKPACEKLGFPSWAWAKFVFSAGAAFSSQHIFGQLRSHIRVFSGCEVTVLCTALTCPTSPNWSFYRWGVAGLSIVALLARPLARLLRITTSENHGSASLRLQRIMPSDPFCTLGGT